MKKGKNVIIKKETDEHPLVHYFHSSFCLHSFNLFISSLFSDFSLLRDSSKSSRKSIHLNQLLNLEKRMILIYDFFVCLYCCFSLCLLGAVLKKQDIICFYFISIPFSHFTYLFPFFLSTRLMYFFRLCKG